MKLCGGKQRRTRSVRRGLRPGFRRPWRNDPIGRSVGRRLAPKPHFPSGLRQEPLGSDRWLGMKRGLSFGLAQALGVLAPNPTGPWRGLVQQAIVCRGSPVSAE